MANTVTWARVKSPWVLHFNSGACNGCDIEIVALLTPKYDVERFGVKLEPSPRHADVLLTTGCVTQQCAERLKRIYDQMPQPKFVVAIGACGCPPRPEAILDGVVKLLNALSPPKPKKQPKQVKQPELPKEEAKPEVAKPEVVAPQEAKLTVEEAKPDAKQ